LFRASLIPWIAPLPAVAIAVVLRLSVDPALIEDLPFLLLFAAVTLSAWLGGLGPGLLAVGLSMLAVKLVGSSAASEGDHFLLFVVEAVFISLLAHSLHRARAQSEVVSEQFRLLVDGTRDYAILMLDPEGHIVHWNEAAHRIFGYEARTIVGASFDRFFTASEREEGRPRAVLDEAARRGRLEYEGWRVRRDGTQYWANVILTPLRDDTGRLRGFSEITRDVTEQRRAAEELRRSEHRFRTLADGNLVGVFFWSAQGRITDANDAFRRLLGGDALAADAVPFAKMCAQIRAAGTCAPFETELRRGDGSPLPVLLGGAAFDPGGEEGVGFVVDLRERKHLEDELRRRLEELDAAARQKDQYIAALAHELRNPLAPIQTTAELLQLRDTDEERQGHYRLIERQVLHLRHLLDDLLDLSRFERGALTLSMEDVDLARVVQEAMASTKSLFHERRHTIEVRLDEGLWVRGDPVRITQILINVLHNAAKYTDPGGTISLSAAREGSEAVVRVRDTGIGMTPEMLATAFDVFTQADRSLARTQGGLGLGLAIVRRLTELHGGKVTAQSAGLGKGTEVEVRLPLLSASAPATPARPATASPLAATERLSILVVDDSVENAETMASLLGLKGHTVELAHDGPAALAACARLRPDAVLLDIGLPGMTGYEVARALRSTPELRGMGIIAMTGYGQEADRAASREVGIDEHLVKPVKLARLMEALASVRKRVA
jgi:PAS domain S-box-containing protein